MLVWLEWFLFFRQTYHILRKIKYNCGNHQFWRISTILSKYCLYKRKRDEKSCSDFCWSSITQNRHTELFVEGILKRKKGAYVFFQTENSAKILWKKLAFWGDVSSLVHYYSILPPPHYKTRFWVPYYKTRFGFLILKLIFEDNIHLKKGGYNREKRLFLGVEHFNFFKKKKKTCVFFVYLFSH